MARSCCTYTLLLSVVALLAPTATAFMINGNVSSTSELEHPTKTDIIPPMMILQRGCTGSSVVIRLAKNLLADLGVKVHPNGKKEIMRTGHPEKNPWWTPEGDLADAMRKGVQEASDAGQVLVFNAFKVKSWARNKEERRLNKALLDMDTQTVIVHRRNPLDILTCEIRDCFDSAAGLPRGYPVDEKGDPDNSCFERRKKDGTAHKTMALIDLEHLQENLEVASEYPQQMQKSLSEIGLQGGSIIYFEDLVSHEYSEDNLDRSASAWQNLLASLGVTADAEDIKRSLKKAVGTYPPPEPHSESIFNLRDVQTILSLPDMSMGDLIRQ